MKPTSKEVINELSKILDATPKKIKGFITPKEKAKEIFDSMWYQNQSKFYPQQCAMEAVRLLMRECDGHYDYKNFIAYWKEVKKEIMKL